MANEIIRPTELPPRSNPVASEVVPSDNGASVGGVSWKDGVNAGRPMATRAEAEAGVVADKAMSPLTTKQAIEAQASANLPDGSVTPEKIGALAIATFESREAAVAGNVSSEVRTIITGGLMSSGDGLENTYTDIQGQHGWRHKFSSGGPTSRTWYEAGDILSPTTAKIPADFATLTDLLSYLEPRRICSKLTVQVQEGTHAQGLFARFNHPDAINIEIEGEYSNVTVLTVSGVTGTAWNRTAIVALDDVSGADVGHYLMVEANTISQIKPDEADFEGCFRIVSVSGNNVGVLLPQGSLSFPAITSTGFAAKIVKSVLQWDSVNESGIGIYGTTLGPVRHVVFDGQFDVATGVGSDFNSGAGLVVAGWGHPTAGEAGTQSGGAYGTFNHCGFVRWKYNGTLVHSCAVNVDRSHFIGNGWRGAQAAGNGVIFGKFSSAHGNRKTGFAQEHGGALNISGGVACGNAEAGVYSIGGGTHNGPNMRTHRNGSNGVDFRYSGYGDFQGSFAHENTGYGVSGNGPGVNIRIDGMTTQGNILAAFRSDSWAHLVAANSPPVTSESTKYSSGVDAPGFFHISGVHGAVTGRNDILSTGGNNGGIAFTPLSTGGVSIGTRANGSASVAQKLTINNDGHLYPNSGGTLDVGRQTENYRSFYGQRIYIKEGSVPPTTSDYGVIYLDGGVLKIRLPNGDAKAFSLV